MPPTPPDNEPLFREMETEELDYGPSWGLILAIVAIGFVAVNVIIVVLSFSAGG